MSDQQHRVTLQQALDIGIEHHTAGRLSQAENIYQQILKNKPKQPVALNLMGVIAHQTGKNAAAVDLLTRALTEKPDYAEAHNNLGLALQGLGKLENAAANHQKAIDLRPNYPEAHYNLGNTFQGLGRLNAAAASYRTALHLKPDYAKAHNNLGNALQNLGKPEQALVSFQAALALDPDLADTLVNLGATYLQLGEPKKAVASYQKAIAIMPDHAIALGQLGDAYVELEQFENAIPVFDLANTTHAHAKKLECLFALGRYTQFYETQDTLSEIYKTNIRAAAISAFASQQLNRENPHPFCKTPLNFIRVSDPLNIRDDVDGILNRLIDQLTKVDSVWEPVGKTTKRGFQTSGNLFDSPGTCLAQLKAIISDEIKKYYSEFESKNCSFIESWPKKMSIKAWFVRLLKGGYQSEHIHPGGWVSGVFYLKLPKTSKREEGAIEFGLWGYDYPILNKNYPTQRYYPKEGQLVLFPSSLFHKTIPFHNDEDRLCVAFDLIPN